MVNNSTNINKTKESLNIEVQHFHQYQFVDHYCLNFPLFCSYWWKCWHDCVNFLLFCWFWWNCWPWLSKLSFVLLIMLELSTIIVWISLFVWYCHQYQQNKRKFKQWWSTIPPILTNQKKVYTVMVYNSTNINKRKESLNIDGQQFHPFVLLILAELLTITVSLSLFCWYLWKSWPKLF
jgi:hypothetical protein